MAPLNHHVSLSPYHTFHYPPRPVPLTQVISLILLTTGVMLANLGNTGEGAESNMVGIMATLGISLASGFAAVYTEKVMKTQKKDDSINPKTGQKYGLAYMQVQLALTSLVIVGVYAMIMDFSKIMELGLW